MWPVTLRPVDLVLFDSELHTWLLLLLFLARILSSFRSPEHTQQTIFPFFFFFFSLLAMDIQGRYCDDDDINNCKNYFNIK